MKSSVFIVAMLVIMSVTACTASDNDPIEQVETIDMLTTYGAQNVATSTKTFKNLHLDELPGVSIKEACDILASIKKHKESEKHYDVKENLHGNHYDVDIIMDETISHKYTFTIQLHMQKDNESGIMYYKSYEAALYVSEKYGWDRIDVADGMNLRTREDIHQEVIQKVSDLLNTKE